MPRRPLTTFKPEDRRELGWERDLEAVLDDADIAKGDYGHRLRILVDEYARHNPNSSKGLRKWAETLSEDQDAAHSAYVKLRKAYTPYWNSYYNQVVKRYEDMVAGY